MPNTHRINHVPTLPPRAADAHKGTFGRVLVIGGSVGMAGAPSLVANAALRSGAGLVTIAVPASILDVVAGLCPCATTIPLPTNKAGQIKPGAAAKRLRSRGWLGSKSAANPPDALVIGPGLGTGSHEYAERMWDLIDAFRLTSEVPTVIDADALNLAAVLPNGWGQRPHPRTIVTPHPGELARLLQMTTRDIQSARQHNAIDTARRLNETAGATGGPSPEPGSRGLPASASIRATEGSSAGAFPAVVILKGAGTIVTDGKSIYTNKTGNPGMATGGSGDVLSGILGALLGQGLSTLDAAILGVHVHGRAGDLAAKRLGEVSLIATDIIEALPEAFRTVLKPRHRKPATKSRKERSK